MTTTGFLIFKSKDMTRPFMFGMALLTVTAVISLKDSLFPPDLFILACLIGILVFVGLFTWLLIKAFSAKSVTITDDELKIASNSKKIRTYKFSDISSIHKKEKKMSGSTYYDWIAVLKDGKEETLFSGGLFQDETKLIDAIQSSINR